MAEIEYKTPEDVREEKMRAKAEDAYAKSLRNTEEAPISKGKEIITDGKRMMRAINKLRRPAAEPTVDAMGNQTGMKKGGSVSSRADGIAQRGKTRGKMC
jgi:hypothetical protein